jgi:hypothetical protein
MNRTRRRQTKTQCLVCPFSSAKVLSRPLRARAQDLLFVRRIGENRALSMVQHARQLSETVGHELTKSDTFDPPQILPWGTNYAEITNSVVVRCVESTSNGGVIKSRCILDMFW